MILPYEWGWKNKNRVEVIPRAGRVARSLNLFTKVYIDRLKGGVMFMFIIIYIYILFFYLYYVYCIYIAMVYAMDLI